MRQLESSVRSLKPGLGHFFCPVEVPLTLPSPQRGEGEGSA